MDWVICSPEEYNSLRMRDFIIGECRLPRNRWIYDIIENKIRDPGECIFIDHSAWCLCLDKHRCLCALPARCPRAVRPRLTW